MKKKSPKKPSPSPNKSAKAPASSKLASTLKTLLSGKKGKTAEVKKKVAPPVKVAVKAVATKPVKVAPVAKVAAKQPAPVKAAPPAQAVVVKAAPPTKAPEPVKARGKGKGSITTINSPLFKKKGFESSIEITDETVCREVACEGLATSGGYCRLHYIKNWKKIKRKEVILKEGRLVQYIEELVSKYPEKYIEAIRHDLISVKEFAKVIRDLDLDEGIDDFDGDGEQDDDVIDNIRRDFEDETDL